MDNALDFGIQITLALQNLGGWLLTPMEWLSFLGSENFFLLIAPILFWCSSPRLGLRFGLILVFSAYANLTLKILFHAPRPYWYTTQVKAYAFENTFGLPSNHAQITTVTWGMLAEQIRHAWFWVVTIALIILVGVSRIYLGVHFITDVLCGWLVGVLILWGILKFEEPIIAWGKTRTLNQQILAAFVLSFAMVLFSFIVRWLVKDWPLPQAWVNNAAVAFPDKSIHPFNLSDSISYAGLMLGLLGGAILGTRQSKFNVQGTAWQYFGRYVIGLIGVLIIWQGLGMVFPRGEYLMAYILRYLRYALAGAWISWLAPLFFLQLKLAKARKD